MKTMFAAIVLAALCTVSMAGYLGGIGGRDAAVTVSLDNQRAAPYGGLGAYGAYGLGHGAYGAYGLGHGAYGAYGLGHGAYGLGLGYGGYGLGLGYGLGHGAYGLGYGLGLGYGGYGLGFGKTELRGILIIHLLDSQVAIFIMKSMFAAIVLAALCAVSMAGYLGGIGGRDAAVTVSLDNQRAAPYGGLGAYGGAYGAYGLGYGGYGLGLGYGLGGYGGYGLGLGYGLGGYGGYGLGYGLGYGGYGLGGKLW
ncbi:chorion class B protein B.L1-like [Centruroides sculpturatus]|uniref:chorion class B protein B.L1-like n=1 Tax=Centruroides sculpturatus TaxID=218467 RepID=UPI000C6DE69C|nr:chorion class B protein B.L1-like [Centruroides sculpturatus]